MTGAIRQCQSYYRGRICQEESPIMWPPSNNIPLVLVGSWVTDVGCRMSGAGCRVRVLGVGSGTGSGTGPGTVLALLLPLPRPSLATNHPVYALVDTCVMRASWYHPGTPVTPGTSPAPPATSAALHGHSTARGRPREATGLTLGCTRGHMHCSSGLAP